ncbi:MAG: serine/threonine protein kinase [Chthonomonadales bacterium]|nr:serine/threonine protein kinase [Chthonomonadales bacterium]
MALGRLGKYDRVDVLGHGASGIVYLAWDTLLKKQVALKEIDIQAPDVERFLEEARVMDRLRHPNIVRVNGVDRIEGHVVIDMEYVKGDNLQEMLRAEGRLPFTRAMEITAQVLGALDYAHTMRTVHRDVKPANILVTRSGQARLLDFGLAEILATNAYAGGAGTYAYMAPEDFAEERQSDHRSDIWAVGVMLYEMLTGRRPFACPNARDPFAWRRVLLEERPEALALEGAPADVRDRLQSVLDCALAREKSDRYASAGSFRDDLLAILAGCAPATPAARVVEAPALQGVAVVGALQPARSSAGAAGTRADTPESAPDARRGRRLALPGRARAPLPATVDVAPAAIDFGSVRKGDDRQARVVVRLRGGVTGGGRVVSVPAWVEVNPRALVRRRESLTVTLRSGAAWQTGCFRDAVELETEAGPVRIPVAATVLPARPRFAQVAPWLVPLIVLSLLPALTVVVFGTPASARHMVAPAATTSGLLAAMLLLVTSAADLGVGERLAPGTLMVVMAMVLGVVVGADGGEAGGRNLSAALRTGLPIGALLAAQVLSRARWKAWAAVLAALSVAASAAFAGVMRGAF